MKKMFSLLVIVSLSCFAIGCSGEPGVSVESDVSSEDEATLLEMADPTAGLEDGEGGGAGADAGGGGEESTDDGESTDGGTTPE